MRASRSRSVLLTLTITAALVAAIPAARGDTAVLTGSFTALTYNVAGLPEPLSGSEPAINSALISPLLNAYDLVLLQEDWADLLTDAREAGLVGDDVPRTGYHDQVVGQADHRFRSVPVPALWGVDLRRAPSGPTLSPDGLNRLSRLAFGPVTRTMWEQCHGDLSETVVEEVLAATGADDVLDAAGLSAVNEEIDGGSADCMAQKGFSLAQTEVAPGVTIDVYNLHADAGGHENDQAARQAGFAQLAAYILEHSAGHAVILGGDTNLNVTRPDRPLDGQVWSRFLADTGLVDACSFLTCGDDDIDKFAFRSSDDLELVPMSHTFERARFTRDDGEPLSDHHPLAVTFEWTAKAS